MPAGNNADMPAIAPGPPSSPRRPLILFDGVCNLCNAAVQWVIARDRRGAFDFASLQSKVAARILAGEPAPLPDSIMLVDDRGVRTRSDAAIGIAAHLGFPWSLGRIAVVVPRPLRDWAYRTVASNRYRWFGRRESCMAPTAALRARFLDADEWSGIHPLNR